MYKPTERCLTQTTSIARATASEMTLKREQKTGSFNYRKHLLIEKEREYQASEKRFENNYNNNNNF